MQFIIFNIYNYEKDDVTSSNYVIRHNKCECSTE